MYDSNTNGDIESAVKQVKGMVRTMKLGIEARIGGRIPQKHPVIPWIVRQAGQAINRFQTGKDGMTAHRRLRGRNFRRRLLISVSRCGI